MQRRWALWLLAGLAILLLVVLLAGRPRELVEGVWTVDVPEGCSLDYHVALRTLALACPGMDYTRVWPLPVIQPWEEPGSGQHTSKLVEWTKGVQKWTASR